MSVSTARGGSAAPRTPETAAPTGLPGARRPRRGLPALRGFFWLMIGLLYLPIVILFVFSLNANTTLSFPLRGFTLDWYEKLFATSALLTSIKNSLIVAVGSSVVATTLGTMVAILLSRFNFRGRNVLTGLAVLPLLVPYVVLGVAMLVLFTALGIERSLLTVGVAHAVVALPYATLIVLARMVAAEPQLEEAAMDLGATYPSTLRLVVVPMAAPAIVSAWITSFTVSFDEFALALFLAGREQTFPVYLIGQLRFAQSLPVLIAAAVLLMIGTLTLILVADRVRRR
ncbi:MAG TPA: ABC transporter permease [Candidatus Limnocylindria bacterium]|nr:ABC transporter permease [Candidatus Limnocylindria bacterium]